MRFSDTIIPTATGGAVFQRDVAPQLDRTSRSCNNSFTPLNKQECVLHVLLIHGMKLEDSVAFGFK